MSVPSTASIASILIFVADVHLHEPVVPLVLHEVLLLAHAAAPALDAC